MSPFTVPGDVVLARLAARRRRGREGSVVERLAAGAGRADPPCSHFGLCGGCMLQHLDVASYREAKLGTLRSALQRVGIVRPLRVVPPTRRRVRLGLSDRKIHAFPRALHAASDFGMRWLIYESVGSWKPGCSRYRKSYGNAHATFCPRAGAQR